jgi:hypothetical protein
VRRCSLVGGYQGRGGRADDYGGSREMSQVSGKEVNVRIRSNEEIERLKESKPVMASQL